MIETPMKTGERERKGITPKPLPRPNSDFYELYGTLKPEKLATVKRVREFKIGSSGSCSGDCEGPHGRFSIEETQPAPRWCGRVSTPNA